MKQITSSRTLAKDVAEHIGSRATVQGWLHKKRLLGGLNFISLRDRSGLVQILVEKGEEVEKLRGLQIGTVLSVTGEVLKDDRAPGGAEIHDPVITVQVPVIDEPPVEIDKPLSHKSEHLDTLLDNRAIGLRNMQETALFKTQAAVGAAIRDYFIANECVEMHTPKLLAEATEGGTEVFKLDYFGKEATLAQSPQFYKQMMVGVFERVYEIAPVFRAEPSATTRHMTEYTSVDCELGFINFEELLNFSGNLLIHVIESTWKTHEPAFKSWNIPKALVPENAEDIPRITIDEIHEMFLKATKEDHTGEDDLAPAEEKWICEWAKKNKNCDAVFVTGWSAKSKTFKFYHIADEQNPDVAQRADLLFRGVEIATLSMRQHDYTKLIQQLKSMGGDANNAGYAAYLSAFKYGLPPHGGFGLGLERLVEKMFKLNSIKEATLFPRDLNRLAP
jgi:nondiscriminating aspartyl-tRNA synthetase